MTQINRMGVLLVVTASCAARMSGSLAGSASDAGTEDGGYAINIPSREQCGNAIDDDDDGMIDEDCACEPGTSRPCYLGPPETRNKGLCTDGTQACRENGEFSSWGECWGAVMPTREIIDNGTDEDCDGTTDEGDGICLATATHESGAGCSNGRDDDCDTLRDCRDPDCHGAAGCPSACAGVEDLCFGGIDDDCDGVVDCDDPDCAEALACIPGPCGPGETATYRERELGSSFGASGITPGDGGAVMPMTCEPGRCEPGLAAVETSPGSFACVPPPPPCPEGTHPSHVGSGTWRCDPPCDMIIHYGTIYGGLNVCAGTPDVVCGGGEVPTFVFETERWECRPTCDNGLYDQIWVSGSLVCVPC
jgi:hypothetical protein